MKILHLILWIACVVSVVQAKKKNQLITTFIDAKWNQTPLVLEIAEFLAEENSHLFWKFIDGISSLDVPFYELENEKIKYETAIKEASKLISETRIKLLKLSVSMHLYSPRIEMYSQISNDKSLPCPTVVEIFDRNICSVIELESLIQNKTIGYESSEIFSLDYHYPGSENKSIVAILYGEIGTKEFTLFHNVLKQYAERDEVDYIFRHYVKNRMGKRVRLSGYGVELQMKSTEYKAQDDSMVNDKNSSQEEEEDEIEGFVFKKLKSLYPTELEELDKIKQTLLQSSDELTPLKVWQFQELGVQAVQRIMDTPLENALDTFIHIAQSFPTQTRSLVDVKVNPELKKEIHKNQDKFLNSLNLQATDTALFLNGIFFDVDAVDFMGIFDVVRQEIRVMEALYSIGINDGKLLNSILSLKIFDGSGKKYGLDCRDTAVVWINDVENDQRYRRWSSNLMDLLRPMFPGMMRSVRRNIFNLVIICDPASKKSWPLLKMAESFIVHNAPIRVGIVFSTPPTPISGLESGSVALLNAFNYVVEQKTTFDALGFITEVYASIKEDRDVEVQDVKNKLEANHYGVNIDDVFGIGSDYNTGRHLAADFIARSGLRNLPQALVNGVPLSEENLNQEEFEDAMVAEISLQTPPIQKAVFKDELKNDDDVFEYIMSKSTIMPRLNTRILNKENNKFLDLTDDSSRAITENINYVQSKSSRHPILFTYWIVGDFETEQATSLLKSAFDYLEESDSARIGVIANPLNLEEEGYNKIISAFMMDKSRTADELYKFLDKKIGVEEMEMDVEKVNRFLESRRKYLKKVSIANAGETVIICNGRVIGPFEKHEEFTMADFQLLEKHSTDAYVEKIHNVVKSTLEKDGIDKKWDVFMKAVSLLTSKPRSNTRFDIPEFSDKYSVIKLPPRSDTEPSLDIVVIVDPVSRGAQKVGPIVSILQKVLNTNVRIFMNCVERVSDLPLKSYYRFVLEPEVKFNEDGSLYEGPMAIFTNVSPTSLLTQNMHVPDNWLVESIATLYDLDNIRLDHVQSNVHSQFELEYLLLEGHCFDTAFGNPPRGLQITLGTIKEPVIVDTIVMANLGYFQLKANPGSWILRLREGRSSDLYDIVNQRNDDISQNKSNDVKVFISSFQSNVMKLRVAKKPGKANEDLLSDDKDSGGLWNSITSTFTGTGNEEAVDETINVFSLASGHLYERFLKIMMLSVLKNTKHPVKFWFLKNYLSPTFKDILPKMSKAYNFQYELVQYKWPRWLHQQSEKQRTIWGYKILFLDVLFPLSVKKIIFVDADQIVRADLKELIDFDLQGAPYGYTPFCESRKEMDGFRFWKQGYWKSHLQGRRYHISALYVVDLKRFRKIAAGDRLRGQYQALSQDPNSLSNLDQDLPNNMIHQVPIKSLPQEWLWCETWCDEKSKDEAKTIDMCNNPLTKEAKLTAAMRIAPEWKEYDNEIKNFQLRVADEDIQYEEIGKVQETISGKIGTWEKEDKHTEL